MNLVLSGPVDEALLAAIEQLSCTTIKTFINGRAWRLNGVDDTQFTRRGVAALCTINRIDYAYIEAGINLSDFRLLALDMDSTLINVECIDEIADFVGRKEEVAAITQATMSGQIKDFSDSLRSRVALLAGTPVDVLQKVFNERLRLSPGASELIDVAQLYNIPVVLVSGGFTYFSDRLKTSLKLNAAYANEFEVIDGKLTGKILGQILDGNAKARRLRQIMSLLDCKAEQAIVIGDGANDVQMMKCVKYSVAYHAKPLVSSLARLQITYGSLRQVIDYFS